MKKLSPYLPFDADETPMSWATRLAAFHTGERLIPFLNDIGISLNDMLGNRDIAIERLCDLGCEDLDKVSHNAIRMLSRGNYEFRGNSVSHGFLHGRNCAFCPACLAEDDAHGIHSNVQRRGRVLWQIRAFRTCPYHNLPLIERLPLHWSDATREMAIRVPEKGSALTKLAEDLTPRTPSQLQDYIVARLNGEKGPEWLDGQKIEQAFHATEMLGVILEFGPKPNLHRLTSDNWDAAGRAGFAYSSRNEDGIREGLTLLQERFVESAITKTSLAGPQIVFGRLYQWLEFNRHKKDRGPIREVMREHLLDTMDVHPSKILFGEEVRVRRRHSVQSLADATGVNSLTLQKFLVANALISSDPAARLISTIDAEEGERLVKYLKSVVTHCNVPRALNTSKGQAEQLIRSGILPTITQKAQAKGLRSGSVDSAVLQGFLADLRKNAQPVAGAPDGMFGIPKTAQIALVPSTVIVRLLLDGALAHVCVLMDVPGYSGVLVDPEEVRCVAEPTSEDVLMPAHLIPKQIGSSLAVMRALMAPREGGAYIPAVEGSTRRRTFALAKDVHAFIKEHIGLQSLSEETGIGITELRRRLRIAGVKQIGDPSVRKTWFYRREDLTFI